MSELWKEIFHDSDDYLRLVINDRLSLRWSRRAYDSGVLTSMIVGIPYEFGRGTSGSLCYGQRMMSAEDMGCQVRSGLYVCGVATRPEWRGRGEIQKLMAEQEAAARDAGFDFLFLIPANDKLRDFYRQYGYADMVEMTKEQIRPVCVSCRLSHSGDRGMLILDDGRRYNTGVVNDVNISGDSAMKYLQEYTVCGVQKYTAEYLEDNIQNDGQNYTQYITHLNDKYYKRKYTKYSGKYCIDKLEQKYAEKYLHISNEIVGSSETYEVLDILCEICDQILWSKIVKSIRAILDVNSERVVNEMSVGKNVMSDLLAALYDYIEPALRIWESQWGEWSVRHSRSQWASIFEESMLSGGIVELSISAMTKINNAPSGVLSLKMRLSGDGPHRGMMKPLSGKSPMASKVGVSLMLD